VLAGFEILTAVVMKKHIFIMPYRPVESHPTFRRNMLPPSVSKKPSKKPA
jgi:hypothetical protein